jgi:hypothetical protein
MPHKINADRRNKIPKRKYRVANCPAYNEGLRKRENMTIWISEEAPTFWQAAPRTTPGGQPVFSDLAIDMCLIAGHAFQAATAADPGTSALHCRAVAGRDRGA